MFTLGGKKNRLKWRVTLVETNNRYGRNAEEILDTEERFSLFFERLKRSSARGGRKGRYKVLVRRVVERKW